MRISFTDRELDVMAVLWDRGSATVAEVRERLPDDLAYTTVLSVLRTLEEKGPRRPPRGGEGAPLLPARGTTRCRSKRAHSTDRHRVQRIAGAVADAARERSGSLRRPDQEAASADGRAAARRQAMIALWMVYSLIVSHGRSRLRPACSIALPAEHSGSAGGFGWWLSRSRRAFQLGRQRCRDLALRSSANAPRLVGEARATKAVPSIWVASQPGLAELIARAESTSLGTAECGARVGRGWSRRSLALRRLCGNSDDRCSRDVVGLARRPSSISSRVARRRNRPGGHWRHFGRASSCRSGRSALPPTSARSCSSTSGSTCAPEIRSCCTWAAMIARAHAVELRGVVAHPTAATCGRAGLRRTGAGPRARLAAPTAIFCSTSASVACGPASCSRRRCSSERLPSRGESSPCIPPRPRFVGARITLGVAAALAVVALACDMPSPDVVAPDGTNQATKRLYGEVQSVVGPAH